MKGILVFVFGYFRFLDVIAVGFVYYEQVCHFHYTSFNSLQFVAAAGEHKQEEKVGNLGYCCFRLSYADGFHENSVVSCCFAKYYAFAGFAGYAA